MKRKINNAFKKKKVETKEISIQTDVTSLKRVNDRDQINNSEWDDICNKSNNYNYDFKSIRLDLQNEKKGYGYGK